MLPSFTRKEAVMTTYTYSGSEQINKGTSKYGSLNSINNSAPKNLTKRELEVLSLVVLGHTAKEIGQSLIISFRTVEAYINTLKFKLGCQSKREIIKTVIKTGLIFRLGLVDS